MSAIDTGTDQILAHRDGAVGWLTFNNPAKHNAVSFAMWQAIPRVLDAFDADDAVRCIVLTGAGNSAFVSGADISEFGERRSGEAAVKAYDEASTEAMRRIAEAAKPTIAMIRGYCIGGGLGIAASTDIRIATEDARFAIPAAKLGVGYGFDGTRALVSLVGPAFAKEIFFSARVLDASEAKGMGLVNRVVATGDLSAVVADLTDRIAANAPLTIRTAKQAVNAAIGSDPDGARTAIEAMVSTCFASEDYAEGRRAFMEKRKPQFRGR